MPELTQQDKDSYRKLYSAAEGLSKLYSAAKGLSCEEPPTENVPQIGIGFTLKELTSAFFGKLLKPDDLSSFNELQLQIELTGGYLTMYKFFPEPIDLADRDQKDYINKASQELLIQYTQLKKSLKAEEDDFLNGVTTPHSDPFFLELLTDSGTSKVKSWTQQLLSDRYRSPVLTDDQVQNLVDAWGIAVTAFFEDARKQRSLVGVKPGEAQTIAHFFCIHDQLEGLYSELSTSVALSS